MTKEALGELILSSERQLYATAKTILSDDQDCADAIQESIVKAFSKIDTLKKDRYAKTWLMRILINECYNIARRINVNEPLDEGYAENMKQPKENRDYSELYESCKRTERRTADSGDPLLYGGVQYKRDCSDP